MNRKTLVTQLHKKTGLSKADTRKTLDITLETLLEALYKGETVTLHNFGVFSPIQRASKLTTNPKTHELLRIKEFKTIKFKPSENVKKELNDGL